jgi:3-isopropylmalate dehydratase small subunit
MEKENIDTDAIIPKQFLKTIKRTGLGSALFYEMRYNPDGSENASFVLNRDPYRSAKIIVCTGANFGCGSSREHAPWALADFGIRCVIAPSFADIFHNNSMKNGILPIRLPQETIDALMAEAQNAPDPTFTVDLEQNLILRPTGNEPISFRIDPFNRECLLEGLDDIGLTMQKADKIKSFESRQRAQAPWLYPSAA